MNRNRVFVLKFNKIEESREKNLENLLYRVMCNNFTDEEMDNHMIQDEKRRTLVIFLNELESHKIEEIVNQVKENIGDDVIELSKDLTNDFLMKNDFSEYPLNNVRFKNFLYNNLDMDAVLEKISLIGMDRMTDVDMYILKEASM